MSSLPDPTSGGTLTSQVAEQLRQQIVEGTLRPGARLRETHLSVELGVSRVPVREALRELMREGLVLVVPQRGAIVREMSRRDVNELFDLRGALEVLAARVAAQRCAEGGDPTTLLEAMAAAECATHRASSTAILKANAALHEAVATLSGHALLQEALAPVLARTRWLFAQTAGRDQGLQCQEHQALVNAITLGDATLAEALMAAHVEAGRLPSLTAVELLSSAKTRDG